MNQRNGMPAMLRRALMLWGVLLAWAAHGFAWGASSITAMATPNLMATSANTTLSITVNADPGPVTVTRVEYFNGTTSLGVTTVAPFSLVLTKPPAGQYAIVARATTDNLDSPVLVSNATPLTVSMPYSPMGQNVFYVHTDHLDTPRAIVSHFHTLVWKWDSDGFGSAPPNEKPVATPAFVFNLRFAGQYFDVESGLFYNYFRDYDSQTGRYIQSDPIGLAGGINTYGYVGANPISGTDSRGLLVDTTGAYAGASAAATATGTSVGVAAVGVGAAGAVGVGIGLGFNAAWDHFAGKPFGISVYDWVHPQSDPALQKEIEKTANQREAHRVCDEPPPPNMNPCELARWNLTKMLRCKAARGNLSDKWFGGPDQAHQSHITNNIDPAIERYRNAVDKLCKPGCN